MILDEIKKANMVALKEKNQTARAIYSVVMTKAMLETVKKREIKTVKINKKKKRIIWIEQLQLPLILFWIFLQDLLKRLKHLEEQIPLPCLKSLQK